MTNRRLRSPRVRRGLVALAALAASVLTLPLGSTQAATPGAGTVSDGSRTVAWTGPFMVPTASANCAGPDNPACDNFKLTVQPPSYGFQVEIRLQPFAAGDWDLQVYGPDGGLVGSSGNAPGALETVTLTNPGAGTYTVAAAPFAPNPGLSSYTASATLSPFSGGAAPGGGGGEHVTYAAHAAPKPLGQDAGEPSIGANPKTGAVMYQAGLEALRVRFDDAVSPAKATWTDVSFPTSSAVSLDPIGFTDPWTGRWFSSQLSGTTSLAAFTDDDGASWTPSEGGPLNGGVDHQTMGGGPFAGSLRRDPNGPLYPNAVYYCSQDLVAALCARSDTGGLTFNPAVPIYTSECGGLHGHVQVAADGTVYVPNKNCGGKQGVVVSEDNGLTWSVRTVPGTTSGEWDPYVGIASDGTVYLALGNGDGRPMVAVSRDKGRTWDSLTAVGTPYGITATAFPVAGAGDPNRAAIAFLGTSEPSSGAMGDDPNWPGVWYLYVAHTYDGGVTWTTVNATPGDPVQRGTICGGGFGGCDNGTRNLLDFNGSTVDKDGRFLVAYADGCIDACVVAGPGSFSSVATIARQVSGRRLFAKFDAVTVPSAPQAYAKASAGPPPANVVSWTEPDDHGSAITGYRVYRNGSLLASTGASARNYTDTTIQAGQTYSYTVSAVNGVGEGPQSPPVTPESAPTVSEDACIEPGITVLTDPTGDSTGGDKGKDVQRLSIAEPREIGAGNLEFVLKVASLESVPADTTWPVQFKTPDGVDRWVKMATNPLGQVRFAYGTGSVTGTGTAADQQSRYSADGTIRIVVPRSAIGVAAGSTMTEFLVRIRVEGVVVALTPDNMPDSLARTGSYTVKGNESCAQPQPDLLVSGDDIGIVQQDGKNGKLVTIVAVVHNAGTADAVNVPVRFAVDGVQLSQPTLARIGAGSFARASAQWDTRGQNGDHTIGVTADPAGSIAELNEGNNTGSRTVTVKGKSIG